MFSYIDFQNEPWCQDRSEFDSKPAFTGNRFELPAAGSSQSIGAIILTLNVIVAWAILSCLRMRSLKCRVHQLLEFSREGKLSLSLER
jgi:glutamine synthetase type III